MPFDPVYLPARYASFLQRNAASIMSADRTDDGRFGGMWQGPLEGHAPDAITQIAALDLLSAAALTAASGLCE